MNQIEAAPMKTLAVRRVGDETTVNETCVPSIESSMLEKDENIPHPDDESSDDEKSEALMRRRSDVSTLTPAVNKNPLYMPQPSPSNGTNLRYVECEFTHDMNHDALE